MKDAWIWNNKNWPYRRGLRKIYVGVFGEKFHSEETKEMVLYVICMGNNEKCQGVRFEIKSVKYE